LGGPAQEFPEFILPDPDLGSEALLMAELVDAKVTFVNPTAIGAVNDLKFGLPGENLANVANVVVTPDSVAGGTKRSSVEEVPQSAASLIVAAAPGQPLTIVVDEVVAGDGIEMADFRCNYNAGGDRPCGGSGFSETSVASSTLLVGVTLIGTSSNGLAGAADGSFDVTVSYQ
jgi:hypothetical protein